MYTKKNIKRRLIALGVLFILLASGLIGRLYYIQIINGENMQSKAVEQWLRDVPVSAKRGSIYDRNGVLLATSETCYDIYVKPTLVKDIKTESKVYADILSINEEDVENKISDYTISEVLLKKEVSKNQIQSLLDYDLKSFVATENYTRNYCYGDYLSQILGYVSVDQEGQAGLELYYENYLKGTDGVSLTEGDASGKTIEGKPSEYLPSIDGLDLNLTIDFAIQQEVEKIMEKAKNETGAKSVTALVTDPNTGEILAVTTKPSINLNEIPRDDLDALNSLTRAFSICDTYEPGSTFKTITVAIGLDLGVTSVGHGYFCPGFMMIDGVRTNCHKKTGHGPQTLAQGYTNSCNCVLMQLMQDIGVENFYNYVEKFHLEETLGIDFPSETCGIVIPKQNTTRNDFLRNSFGQSIAISPLQLSSCISAVVTDGYLKKPQFLKSLTTSDGQIVFENSPTNIEKVVSENIISDMRYVMQLVVEKGGGKASKVDGFTVAGKTGTAQKYDNGVVSTGNYIGSYICFSPVENPKYMVSVIIDEPKTSIYGNIVATPVAGEILTAIFNIRGDKPTEVEESDKKVQIEVPNVVGMTLTEANALLASSGFYVLTEGDDAKVNSQIPLAGSVANVGDSVLIKF